jgi:hypothetical protein
VGEKFVSTFDRQTLAALQARDIPRVRAADYFSKNELADAETDQVLARWDAYLAQFARIEGGICICCGQCLAALSPRGIDLMIGGGFEWGVAHGEGRCRYCHYPMRGHHQVDGLGTIKNLFLPYHPSTLAFGQACR